MFIIKLTYKGFDNYLRSTVFTSEIERAEHYATLDDARMAFAKARKFHKPSVYKLARIVQL
jgi:hypothetical protein